MADFADVQDVRDRWEGDIPSGSDLEARVQVRLDDAEAILIQHAGDVQARIDAGKTTAHLVKVVLCDMILRLLRNASGITQESAGPFSRSFDAAVASGKLFLIREDRRRLGMKGQAGSVSLSEADDALACPLRPNGDQVGWIA
ncbi:Gp19/Gp15/Gp42 family protein [Streptomonospora wellingtoniae]|uniref:Gp19/Gp15/Gp42 family protein n=1 Tax=Streptomonospora wellingtoniae TaxID=3075544 RepID=A0ABU2KUE6_9ACTN|nr:Gp19/Gp15/Gp42 family protein [Streptomonospora sp. DSM 45055]MDT0302904.1 Gp19/Gp15/Gp42 family protein [Streptomonospora sp. DSM 45055]